MILRGVKSNRNMTKNHYVVETVSNYATSALEETLNKYGHRGFKLVSTIMGKNKYGAEVMYLFFEYSEDVE